MPLLKTDFVVHNSSICTLRSRGGGVRAAQDFFPKPSDSTPFAGQCDQVIFFPSDVGLELTAVNWLTETAAARAHCLGLFSNITVLEYIIYHENNSFYLIQVNL